MRYTPLALILLTGCNTIDSIVFDSHEPVKKIVIESPPQRIIYYGSYDEGSQEFAVKCLRQMQKTEYRNYKFNETTTVNSNIAVGTMNTDAESFDVVPISVKEEAL